MGANGVGWLGHRCRIGLSAMKPSRLVIAVPYIWLAVLFLAPFFIVLKMSLSDLAVSIPPYTPQLDLSGGWAAIKEYWAALDFENYVWLADDPLYLNAFKSSFVIATLSTLITLCVAYPIAYALACSSQRWRPVLVMLVILPFWTSFLIRVYAWIGILKTEGLLNQLLLAVGVISEPLTILNTTTAVYIGIVYSYLPFMILPIYAALEKMDWSLIEAAEDLGSSRVSAFWLVTFPLSMPGVIAGCFLVFIPAMGEFVIPDLLGGSDTLMIGKTLWVEFFSNRDWPVASAVAVILLVMLIVPIVLFQRQQQKLSEAV